MAAVLCKDTSEAVVLCAAKHLYLKPLAKINIQVALPEMKIPGVSISNWEVMEKIRSMVAPDQFSILRVVQSTLELISFEGETETKSTLEKFLNKLDCKFIKLSGFADPLRIRANEAKAKYPSQHDWDSYYRDAKDLNECNPGERPDTVYIKGLPTKWLSESSTHDSPSEKVVREVFSKFGEIRMVDIPILDPYRHKMTRTGNDFQTFYFGSHLHFDVYIQYMEYQGFVKAMTSLKAMKLIYLSQIDGRAAAANIHVDFDKTCHLSTKNIKRRDSERKKICELEKAEEERKNKEQEKEKKQMEKEKAELERKEREKLQHIKEQLKRREEKRKEKAERKRKRREEQERSEKRRRRQERKLVEETQLINEQRFEEGNNLLTILLKNIQREKERVEEEKKKRKEELAMLKHIEEKKKQREEAEKFKIEQDYKKKRKMEDQENELREKLIRNLKKMEERKQDLERELLRKQLTGKARLQSVLGVSKS